MGLGGEEQLVLREVRKSYRRRRALKRWPEYWHLMQGQEGDAGISSQRLEDFAVDVGVDCKMCTVAVKYLEMRKRVRF